MRNCRQRDHRIIFKGMRQFLYCIDAASSLHIQYSAASSLHIIFASFFFGVVLIGSALMLLGFIGASSAFDIQRVACEKQAQLATGCAKITDEL